MRICERAQMQTHTHTHVHTLRERERDRQTETEIGQRKLYFIGPVTVGAAAGKGCVRVIIIILLLLNNASVIIIAVLVSDSFLRSCAALPPAVVVLCFTFFFACLPMDGLSEDTVSDIPSAARPVILALGFSSSLGYSRGWLACLAAIG